MEIEVAGQKYNAAEVCQVPRCPHKTAARVIDTTVEKSKRRDLCFRHAKTMKRVYRDEVEIIAVWNDYTMEDFDD